LVNVFVFKEYKSIIDFNHQTLKVNKTQFHNIPVVIANKRVRVWFPMISY